MRVLVTGGLGYVGRAVAGELTRAGHEVTVLTHAARPRVGPPAGTTLARCDLRDGSAVADLVAVGGYQGVCHLAALTQVRESFEQPVRYYEVNLGGTVALLRAFEYETDRTGEPAHVVFASKAAAYGAVDVERISEDCPARPTSPYGASKPAAEDLLTYQAATGRIGAISLRTFNAAGAVDGVGDADLTRVIPKALAVAAGLKPAFTINGDGSTVREFTHVADLATAYRLALDSATAGDHQIMNAGSGVGVSVRQVLDTVQAITGRSITVENLPPKNEPQVLVADSSLLRSRLHWAPERSTIEQIISDAWDVLPIAA